MSMKGVMILFAIFSLGSLMPAKHWLIETEDGGDDSEGVTETKSKILGLRYNYTIISFFLQTWWKTRDGTRLWMNESLIGLMRSWNKSVVTYNIKRNHAHRWLNALVIVVVVMCWSDLDTGIGSDKEIKIMFERLRESKQIITYIIKYGERVEIKRGPHHKVRSTTKWSQRAETSQVEHKCVH